MQQQLLRWLGALKPFGLCLLSILRSKQGRGINSSVHPRTFSPSPPSGPAFCSPPLSPRHLIVSQVFSLLIVKEEKTISECGSFSLMAKAFPEIVGKTRPERRPTSLFHSEMKEGQICQGEICILLQEKFYQMKNLCTCPCFLLQFPKISRILLGHNMNALSSYCSKLFCYIES